MLNIWKNKKMKNKIAFVAEEYSEYNFSSGGVKLNLFLLLQLKKEGYEVDIYSRKNYNLNGTFNNIYPMSDFTEERRREYDIVLSEKAVVVSDLTYLHDHSNIYRWKYMKKNEFIYKTLYHRHFLSRKEEDERRKAILSNTKKIIVSSNVLKQDIVENYGIPESKIYIIPPPVITAKQKNDEAKKKDKCVFGISATGFERKGGFILLDAVRKIKKLKKDFKVIVIHPEPGWYIKLLINLYGIKKYIEFIDLQNDMGKFYDSLTYLLLPSLIEPFGMVVTEAMAGKIPSVAGSRCGASELIIDGKNGFVFNSDTNPADNLAKAMITAIDTDVNKYNELAENAFNTVKNLTLKDFTDRYVELLEPLIYH